MPLADGRELLHFDARHLRHRATPRTRATSSRAATRPACATTRCSTSGCRSPRTGTTAPSCPPPTSARCARPRPGVPHRGPERRLRRRRVREPVPVVRRRADRRRPSTAARSCTHARRGAGARSSASPPTTTRRSPTSTTTGRDWSSRPGPTAPPSCPPTPGVEQVFVFENRGEAIGVTLRHPHGQIYAYPFVTPRTRAQLDGRGRHRAAHRPQPATTTSLAAERADGSRVVLPDEHWSAFVPFAARWPVEVHLYPHRRRARPRRARRRRARDLADVYLDLLRRGDAFFGIPLPYIAAWHQAPVARPAATLGALHLELFSVQRSADKLKYLAGLRVGDGRVHQRPRAGGDRRAAARGRGAVSASTAPGRRSGELLRPRPRWPGAPRAGSTSSASTPTTTTASCLPFALRRDTRVDAAPATTGARGWRSAQRRRAAVRSTSTRSRPAGRGWAAYVAGVAVGAAPSAASTSRAPTSLVDGSVPRGAGLSSSAALECAVAGALLALAGRRPPAARRRRCCAQRAENEFVGDALRRHGPVRVDARAGRAPLLLDTRRLEVAPRPLRPRRATAWRCSSSTPARRTSSSTASTPRGAPACEEAGAAARRPGAARRRPTSTPRSAAARRRRAAPAGAARGHRDRPGARRRGLLRGGRRRARSARCSTRRTPRCATTTRSPAPSSTSPSTPRRGRRARRPDDRRRLRRLGDRPGRGRRPSSTCATRSRRRSARPGSPSPGSWTPSPATDTDRCDDHSRTSSTPATAPSRCSGCATVSTSSWSAAASRAAASRSTRRSRGLTVGLVEQRDFSAGTSSRSSKLVHGGLRYLEQFNFGLVREALRERALLLDRLAPHLVTPAAVPLPDRPPGLGAALRRRRPHALRHPRRPAALGAAAQPPVERPPRCAPSRRCAPTRSRVRSATTTRRSTTPGTPSSSPAPPPRTARAGLGGARRVIARDGERVVGARVADATDGNGARPPRPRGHQRHRRVGRASPSSSPAWRRRSGCARARASTSWCPRDRIDASSRSSPRRRRPCCSSCPGAGPGSSARPTPRGTTGCRTRRPPTPTSPTCSTWPTPRSPGTSPSPTSSASYAGLRPLVDTEGLSESEISREHTVRNPLPGMVTIAGGKYTTYRVMAEDAVDACERGPVPGAARPAARVDHATMPLIGAAEPEDVLRDVAVAPGGGVRRPRAPRPARAPLRPAAPRAARRRRGRSRARPGGPRRRRARSRSRSCTRRATRARCTSTTC